MSVLVVPGYDSYEDYLRSAAWRSRRQRILRRDHFRCRCGLPAVQVHHLSYSRVGNELDDDLISVCATCHEQIHSGTDGSLRQRTLAVLGNGPVKVIVGPVRPKRPRPTYPAPPQKKRKSNQAPDPNSKRGRKKLARLARQREMKGAQRRAMQEMKQRNAARDAAKPVDKTRPERATVSSSPAGAPADERRSTSSRHDRTS